MWEWKVLSNLNLINLMAVRENVRWVRNQGLECMFLPFVKNVQNLE